MSYKATVLDVMIASPSDVTRERELIREIVHEWNATHSRKSRIVLSPVSWETHSSPKMGEEAQQIINKQVVEFCDLLVAVFWTRLGSPTANHPSGTVEEINEIVAAGKPAMIYFSSLPVEPESIDREQYDNVVAFRNDCEAKGLIERYDSIESFGKKFRRQLAQTIQRYFSDSAEIEGEEGEEVPDGYLRATLSEEAATLILEAAADSSGSLMCLRSMGGLQISTNNKTLNEFGNARSEAIWQGAVDELIDLGLIADRGYKGEVFRVTREGYDAADQIRKARSEG
ncbi:MAG: DUF4062 domain-containing protein [Chrysiogenetes bacterium]|nr:DUF4062 domain-containing protein [Chrysiogenetes bacterium]